MPERMNCVQRVQAALDFQRTDYVPLIENYWGDFVARWRRRQHLQPLRDLPFEDVVEDLEISAYYGVDVAIAIPDESPWPSQVQMLDEDGRYVIYRDGWGSIRRGLPGAEFAARDLEVVIGDKSDIDGERSPPIQETTPRYPRECTAPRPGFRCSRTGLPPRACLRGNASILFRLSQGTAADRVGTCRHPFAINPVASFYCDRTVTNQPRV